MRREGAKLITLRSTRRRKKTTTTTTRKEVGDGVGEGEEGVRGGARVEGGGRGLEGEGMRRRRRREKKIKNKKRPKTRMAKNKEEQKGEDEEGKERSLSLGKNQVKKDDSTHPFGERLKQANLTSSLSSPQHFLTSKLRKTSSFPSDFIYCLTTYTRASGEVGSLIQTSSRPYHVNL